MKKVHIATIVLIILGFFFLFTKDERKRNDYREVPRTDIEYDSVLTVYTDKDIYYLDFATLKITSETGKNIKFTSSKEMYAWLEDRTAKDTPIR